MAFQDLDLETRKTLNKVARHEMIHRLLADISVDLMVCNLEGWNKREYIDELHALIDDIYQKFNQKTTEQ